MSDTNTGQFNDETNICEEITNIEVVNDNDEYDEQCCFCCVAFLMCLSPFNCYLTHRKTN